MGEQGTYTPGPWHASAQIAKDGRHLGWIVQAQNGDRIGWINYANAETNQGDMPPYTQSGINAQLAAAAPELLDALQELVEVAKMRGDDVLPAPPDDPKLNTARTQTAWDDAKALLERLL
jgi:hypothetical protein